MEVSRANCLLPTGTVTFLFTDIEGSTKLWEARPDEMRVALAWHDSLLRETIVNANGYVFKTVGDAFCAAFGAAPDAVATALTLQIALHADPWPKATPIKVRMALHTGAVDSRDGDYFGPPVNRVARLLATGYGGQTLLSQATYELSRDALPDNATLRDLGAHQLKDLARPEQVYELQHPGLRNDFPPIRSLSTHPNNLPQQLTSFIGREMQVTEIEALLLKNRLITLTGSGGCGKTRLGLQVAADSLAHFPDGAWLLELAALTDLRLVPQTVASVLGLREEAGKPITQMLVEHLKTRHLLLLLDNCEHLIAACATLADTLLQQCPKVKILATSREALGIAGEHTYRVPSLSVPDRKEVPTLQRLSTYESVRLFIDRALAVRTDFTVTNQNAPALASVCCHLDGIPLAIELAAARVRSLSVEEIDRKLDERFRLLTGGSKTALPRQQTLRALIDWSYDLLDAAEKTLLPRLSVFAGGWTLEAAESVCAGEGVDGGQVLDLLTSLVDKSLVIADETRGHTRYRLLESVREYAREKLADDGREIAIRDGHRDCFLAVAEEAKLKLQGAEQGEWLQRLEDEHENIRASLEWSLVDETSGAGLRFCGALQQFWWMRGHLSEGRKSCARALGSGGRKEPTRERAAALNGSGSLAVYQSDYRAARVSYEESLAIWRQLEDRRGIARSLGNLGVVGLRQGDFASARTHHEECLEIMRDLGDKGGIANALGNLGNVALDLREFDSARALYEESLTIMRELNDRHGIAKALDNLGHVLLEQGDHRAAQTLYEESLAIERELGDKGGIAYSLDALGGLAHDRGDYLSAAILYRKGLVIRRELGEGKGIVDSMEGLAAVAAAFAVFPRAACIWGAAERLRAEIGLPQSPYQRRDYDRSVAAARAALGDDAAFNYAWQEGGGLTLEQAIELALEKTVEQP